LALAEQADGVNVPDGMSVAEELQRREDRLTAIAAAKGKIEARAAERYAREQADYEAKLAARAAKSRPPGTCFFQHPKRLSWRHNRRLLDKFSALTHYDYWTISQAIGCKRAINNLVVMKDKYDNGSRVQNWHQEPCGDPDRFAC